MMRSAALAPVARALSRALSSRAAVSRKYGSRPPSRRALRTAAAIGAATLALSGCGYLGLGGREQATVDRATRERSVDPVRAAELINAHRAANGRTLLTVDPTLNAVAAETAAELARRDRLTTEMHTATGLQRRLDGRFRADSAAENLGAGYPTLVQTVAGWKASRGHNDNLLNRDYTDMGIGLALSDRGAFHSYWVLVLARRDDGGS